MRSRWLPAERLDRESIVTVGQDRYGDHCHHSDDDNENDQKILSLQKSGSWLRGCGWADIDKYKIYHKLGIQGKASESESQKRRKKSKCDVGNLSITCMGIRILKHWSSAFWGFILREIKKITSISKNIILTRSQYQRFYSLMEILNWRCRWWSL